MASTGAGADGAQLGAATFFDILGVPEDCEDDELIKQQYRKLALQNHPDRQRDPQQKELATIMMSRINQAYDTLKDPEKRRHYRQQLHNPEAAGLGETFGDFEKVRIVRLRPKVPATEAEVTPRLKQWAKNLRLKPMTMNLSLKHLKCPYPAKGIVIKVLHMCIPIRFVFRTSVYTQKLHQRGLGLRQNKNSGGMVGANLQGGEFVATEEETSRRIDREIEIKSSVVVNLPIDQFVGEGHFVNDVILPAMSTPPSAASSKVIRKLPRGFATLGVTLGEPLVATQEKDAAGKLPPLKAEVVETPTDPTESDTEDIHLPPEMRDGIIQLITVQLWEMASKLKMEAMDSALKQADEDVKGTDWVPVEVEVVEDETRRDIGDLTILSLRVPVIVQIFKHHHKDYAFMLNAATGETGGVRPYSFSKRILMGIGGTIVGLTLLML